MRAPASPRRTAEILKHDQRRFAGDSLPSQRRKIIKAPQQGEIQTARTEQFRLSEPGQHSLVPRQLKGAVLHGGGAREPAGDQPLMDTTQNLSCSTGRLCMSPIHCSRGCHGNVRHSRSGWIRSRWRSRERGSSMPMVRSQRGPLCAGSRTVPRETRRSIASASQARSSAPCGRAGKAAANALHIAARSTRRRGCPAIRRANSSDAPGRATTAPHARFAPLRARSARAPVRDALCCGRCGHYARESHSACGRLPGWLTLVRS